jgi:hypothetical protein
LNTENCSMNLHTLSLALFICSIGSPLLARDVPSPITIQGATFLQNSPSLAHIPDLTDLSQPAYEPVTPRSELASDRESSTEQKPVSDLVREKLLETVTVDAFEEWAADGGRRGALLGRAIVIWGKANLGQFSASDWIPNKTMLVGTEVLAEKTLFQTALGWGGTAVEFLGGPLVFGAQIALTSPKGPTREQDECPCATYPDWAQQMGQPYFGQPVQIGGGDSSFTGTVTPYFPVDVPPPPPPSTPSPSPGTGSSCWDGYCCPDGVDDCCDDVPDCDEGEDEIAYAKKRTRNVVKKLRSIGSNRLSACAGLPSPSIARHVVEVNGRARTILGVCKSLPEK